MKNLFFVVAMFAASTCFASAGDCADGRCRPVASVARASVGVVSGAVQASATAVGGVVQTGSCVVSRAVGVTRRVAQPALRPVRRVVGLFR